MNKKLIRLTESDLHNIIRESVQKILKETYDPCDELGHLRWRNRDYRNDNKEAQRVGKVRGNALANWHKLAKDSESKVQEEGYDDEYNPHPDDNWHGYGNTTKERWDADEIPYQYKQVHESAVNEMFNTPKGQAIAAHVFGRAKDRGLDAWEKDEPTEKYDDVAHQAFNTAKQHWSEPRNKEAFRFGYEQRKLGNSPQRTLYNLKKLKWENAIKHAVEQSINEVVYNGQSLHGNNPKDWLAMNKYRKSIADKYYNDEMNNLAAIRNYGHRQLNEPEEQLPYPNNSVEGLPSSERNSRAMSRNMDNAINLLQKGANIDQ